MALTDSLISYWKMDQASGDEADSHDGNILTAAGGDPPSVAGKINSAREFGTHLVYFEHADNTDLSTGDIDFTFSAWLYLQNNDQERIAISKGNITTDAFEYSIGYHQGLNRFLFRLGSGAASVNVAANNFGVPSLDTWYFVLGWHDATANTISIQVNNGSVDSDTDGLGGSDNTLPFRIGSETSNTIEWIGRIDEVGFWKRTLTSGERTSLYNGGAGFAYPFTASTENQEWLTRGHADITRRRLVKNTAY